MKYVITYYSEQVEKEVLNLPRTLAMRYVHITKLMLEYGGNIGMPHTKSLGDGLFELRLKGQEGIARVFYCTLVDKEIVMLHSFIKKTDKIPGKELAMANKRKLEVQNGKIHT
jgi:phage-related protein